MESRLDNNVETIKKLVSLIELIGEDTFKQHILTYLHESSGNYDCYGKFEDHILAKVKHKKCYSPKSRLKFF